jgi:2-phospho-L-lactate guanylyltransferase (CobY/MobA/RfbA family)
MRSPSRRCVVLFARAPRAEARRKSLPAAEALFRAVARHVRQEVALLPRVDLLCCAPGVTPAPDGRRISQRGHDFASRLARAFADARALGYDDVVVIPGDVPGIDARTIARAFDRLRTTPVVLGPSPDGGVYLIGCHGSADGLLRGVRWCTPHVTRDLLARAPGAALLDQRRDVDGPRDLSRVRHDASVPCELRALVAFTVRPVGSLAFAAAPMHGRAAAAPDPPRGPPVLH